MHVRSITLQIRLLVAWLIIVLPAAGLAFTFRQVGVDSNLLIDDGRVFFAQADGSFTGLELETGSVIYRKTDHDYSGTLKRTTAGIIVLNYGTISLLDATDLSLKWQTTFHYDPNVLSNHLVSYDGNGLVQCRQLQDGDVLWTFDLPGALEVVAETDKVLVHRAATFEDTVQPATVLLDLATGRELLRKTPPTGIHWDRVFFDGTNIFVQSGEFTGKRADYKPRGLSVWDLSGTEIRFIEFNELPKGDAYFNLDDRIFYRGRVYASQRDINPDYRGFLTTTRQTTNGGVEIFETEHELGEGISYFERTKYSQANEQKFNQGSEFGIITGQTNHVGTFPYLNERGHIRATSQAKGKLLVGSNLGHIECIDLLTGTSHWLYVFPTIRHTMSYSSHGLPPMLADAAAVFRRQNENPPTHGFRLLAESPATTRLILDPKPFNPYSKLWLYLLLAWSSIAVAAVVLLAQLSPKARSWKPDSKPALLLAVIAALFVLLLFFGRVSLGSAIAMRIAMASAFVCAFANGFNNFRQGRRGLAVVTFASLGISLFIVLPLLIQL